MALQMGVWTPLPHTIKAEPRMEAAVERLQRPGSAQGPEDAYEFAVEVLQRGERNGFEITLVAARHLGPDLDAWTLASALAARTTTMKIMVAAHPGIHTPQMIAKMAASLDRISGGRAAINVVNGWNVDEFNLFGNGAWLPEADARHKRMDEFIQVMKGMWGDEPLNFDGEYYRVENGVMPLKIAGKLPPQLYATSQSPEGMETIARYCDYWFVADKGDFRKFDETLEFVRQQLAAMGELAGRFGRRVGYCASANVVCADTEEEAIRKAEALEEYGRIRRYNKSAAAGVGFCLVGTPQTIADRIRRYEDAGLDLMLFQFSPMMEGLDNFIEKVLPLLGRGPVAGARAATGRR